jgi:spore germination cell wall hydrolase CwlJ-like protein
MSGSLFYQVRTWPMVWRARLFMYSIAAVKDSIAFGAMLGLPIIALSAFVYCAYVGHDRAEGRRQRSVDLHCLAENIYFEARGEPLDGQYAVAEVTLNRVASLRFPDTICEVVHEARWDPLRRRRVAAFSWTELPVRSKPRGAAWQQAMLAAAAVYDGRYIPVVPDALFYHASSVEPYWAKAKKSVATIGSHIFYE